MTGSLFIKTCLLAGVVLLSGQLTYSAFEDDFDDIRFNRSSNVRVSVSSNLYEGDEDEVRLPFAATIYLLPESTVDLLKRKNFTPTDENGVRLADEQSYLEAVAYSLSQKDDESLLLGFLIYEALNENKIVKFNTGESGHGKTEIENGSYYLFAAECINDEVFVWDFPVDLYYSNNTPIEIDQYNAATLTDIE